MYPVQDRTYTVVRTREIPDRYLFGMWLACFQSYFPPNCALQACCRIHVDGGRVELAATAAPQERDDEHVRALSALVCRVHSPTLSVFAGITCV